MNRLLLISLLVVKLLIQSVSMAAMSSKVHADIDRVYDQLSENQEAGEETKQESGLIMPATSPDNSDLFHLVDLPEIVLVELASYIDDPMGFSMSCRYFWNIISAMTSFRVFEQILRIVPDRSSLLAIEGSSSSRIPAVIRAFGNRELRVKPDLIARNLELALCSPAFRAAFDGQTWRRLRETRQFGELTERILMESQDDSFIRQHSIISSDLEAHRRALLYILASLPLANFELIETFFRLYPIELLNPGTEVVFEKLVSSISERVAVLPSLRRVLGQFAFDGRLLQNVLKIYLQNGLSDQIRSLLFEIPIPEEFRVSGHFYIGGCVSVQVFVRHSRQFLNLFDQQMSAILRELERRAPAHIPPFFLALCDRFHEQGGNIHEKFHVAVLKSAWPVLEQFEDFDFSYEKGDGDFLAFLIRRDPIYATQLISRIPRIASHKAFLLNLQFQSRHFSTFNKLKVARIELKRTIACPEVTRAHIRFIQDFQGSLFRLLSEDSAARILNYFTMNLKGHERKRYKEHASFTIALTVIDVGFETVFFKKFYNAEVDPEGVLKSILSDMKIMRSDQGEYFEIAHSLPSFSRALLVGDSEFSEDVLYTPEAALTQSISEFELLARTFALNRVIHDGSAINYRLVLQWFQTFELKLAGRIIPLQELKSLIKGAAFNTFRSVDDKRLVFNLDTKMDRDEPFSMTYRYALIIIVTQSRGNRSAAIKKVKSLFGPDNGDESTHASFMNLLVDACVFYRKHLPFFSYFKFVATNTRSERFLLDFIRQFIISAKLTGAAVGTVIAQFFEFIQVDPEEETLLRDHLVYFILLASFKRS